jgi:phage-related tail fiber protein
LGTLSNTGVTSATYGSSTSIPVISVDAKGRISSVTTQGVNFSSATVNATDNIKTSTASTDTSYYPTFVYQNSGGAYQSLYTDGGITYNPSTDTLTAGRGLFTANLSVDTAGAATTTSTIVFKRSGQSITSFGSYAGAWRSALQLQNNDSTRLLFFAPPEQDYQFGIIRAVNGGLKIDVGGNSSNTGVNAISIDTTGAVSFPQGVTGTISGNIASADKLSTARNIAAIGDISWGVIFDGSVNVSAGATLSNTGVTSSTYGSSTLIPVFSVDSKGRITSVTNTGISFGSATVASADKLTTARNIAITGDLAWNVNFDGSANVTSTGTLANSGVTAGTYGSSTLVPVITVDAKGRVTSVTNTGVNFSASTVASADKLTTARNIAITGDLAWNVNFDGSANVTSTGTLANSGVTAGTYGSTTTIPVFAVDAKGRVTSVTNTAINFSSGATNVTVTQAGYACANPISVIGAGGISIGSTSNAYGTRYIQATAPSSPCDGDIWYDTSLGSSIVPIGSVFYFAASSAPTGYLSCNGAAISRTTYSALFAIISTTYGSGDGSTTFNLPDLRGEFIRGWDNGRGVDSGRTMGSSQSHAIASHDHNFRNFYFAENNGNSGLGNGYAGSRQGNDFDNNPFYIDWTTYGNNGAGTETRPRNVALLPCIRY